jgi:hypothetical protein
VLQLGDGVILFFDPDGQVYQPVPDDPRLFAEETTSLCLNHAENDFQVSFHVHAAPPPALILVSTDGYPKSFRDKAGFHKVGVDLLETIRTEGLQPVRNGLPTWLQDVTREGSGDDMTLGLLCRLVVPAKAAAVPAEPPSPNAVQNAGTAAQLSQPSEGNR